MESVIFTPRLKLSKITQAERGGPDFECLHELHSNEKATWWRSVVLSLRQPRLTLKYSRTIEIPRADREDHERISSDRRRWHIQTRICRGQDP